MASVDVKMEPHTLGGPATPLSAADAQRIQFDCRVRLWGLEVRLLARKLLSLGRSYEVRFLLPPVGSNQRLQLPDLGFDMMSLMDSHLLQVKAVVASRVAQQVVPERPFVGVGIPRLEDVRAIHVEDYLVGMNTQDFLVAPVPLPQFRKQIQQQTQQELVLRFVRLDRFVQVDQKRTHGHVLEVLNYIEAQHAELSRTYAGLLERNRTIVTRELAREKKLLAYVRIIAVETRKTVMEDDRFQFACNFQQWYAAITELQGDEEESEEDVQEEQSFDYEAIDISDDEDEESDDVQAQRVPGHFDVVDLTMTESSAKPPRPRPAQPVAGNRQPVAPHRYVQPKTKQPHHLQQRAEKPVPKASVPRSIDMLWLGCFAAQDLKWFPHAKESLGNFINGLMDSFEQDDFSHSNIPEITRSIAEQLLRLYIHKRHTLSIDNSALHKEFARHVRMLRSNLKNQKNVKLREDLLYGSVTTQRLCEMTSDELAPEALRLERERRYELHAQSSMIKAPTGPTLVKTKHGYKEVNFGEIVGAPEAEAQAGDTSVAANDTASAETPTATTTTENASISIPVQIEGLSIVPPLDAGDLPVIQPLTPKSTAPLDELEDDAAHGVGATEEVTERFQKAVDIQKQSPTTKKRVSFSEDASIATARHELASNASRDGFDRSEAENRKPKCRPVGVKEARDFLLTLFNPAYDLLESLRLFVETLKTAPLATMSREFMLAPGVKVALHRFGLLQCETDCLDVAFCVVFPRVPDTRCVCLQSSRTASPSLRRKHGSK